MKDKEGNEDTIHIPCSICGEKPASEMKGGEYNGLRDMWLCCKDCRSRITDYRTGDRRQERSG